MTYYGAPGGNWNCLNADVIHYDFDASGGETIMLNNEHREEIPINAKLGYYKSPKGTYLCYKLQTREESSSGKS